MNVYLSKSEIIRTLKVAAKVKGNTQPTVTISAEEDGDSVSLVVVGDSMVVRQAVPCTVESGGESVVSSASFADAIRRMPKDLIRLKSDPALLTIESGSLVLKISTTEKAPSGALSSDEPSGTLKSSAGDLERALSAVAYAVSRDDTRYGLNGVSLGLDPSDRISVSATDGHRASRSYMAGELKIKDDARILLSRDAVGLILSALASCGPEDDVSMSLDSWSSLHVSGLSLSFLGLDGQFPDLDSVIPPINDGAGMVVEVNRSQLIDAVSMVDVGKSEQGASSTMRFAPSSDGGMSISMRSIATSRTANGQVAVDASGKIHEFGASPLYLNEALKAMRGDTVKLYHNHAHAPIRITDDTDGVVIVMPRNL